MAEANFVDKTIWTGDNLDILRGLNSESVDLIYLDPPFNSNRNYAAPVGSRAAGAAFKDTWTLSDLDTAWMGLIADEQAVRCTMNTEQINTDSTNKEDAVRYGLACMAVHNVWSDAFILMSETYTGSDNLSGPDGNRHHL